MVMFRVSVDACAAICHEANTAYSRYALEDRGHLSWEECPEELKNSIREGVRAVMRGMTPEQLHENWRVGKLRQGWSYGLSKNVQQKTHPCLIPYTDLPWEQKQKDFLFHAIVMSFRSGECPEWLPNIDWK